MTTFKQRFSGFNSVFVWVFASLFLSLSSTTLAQTLLAGSVAGQFSVNQNGAATYALPIQVPPGVTGMQPQLSLNYNSQDGHGLAGVGWSLGGLSVITRCEQTLAQEGVRGIVNLDDNDRYCLEGQKLMLVAGAYAQDGAEYRTENDKFSKIISYGRSGSGSTWFKAWTKSGQIMEFGNTVDSRVIGSGYTTARQWSLNRVTDVNGNTMTISYLNSADRTTHLPEIITYGGNTVTGTAANRSVLIVYATRPDVTNSYIGNQKLVESSRISKITTKIGTTAVKNYNLTYELSPSTKRSRLTKIDECDGLATSCLKPLAFAYNDADVTVVNRNTAGHGIGDKGKKLVDLFGDGRPVYYTHNSAGDHFATRINADGGKQDWVWSGGHGVGSQGDWEIVDIFGDGRPVYWTQSGFTHNATRLDENGNKQNFQWSGHGRGGNGYKWLDIFGDGKPVYYTRTGDNHYATRFKVDETSESWTWPNTGMDGCPQPPPYDAYDSMLNGVHDLFGDGRQMFWQRCGPYWGIHSAIRFNTNNTVTRTDWDLKDALGLNANLGVDAIHAGGSLVDAYGDGHPVIWSRTGDYSNTNVVTQLNKDGTHLTRTFPNFNDGDLIPWTFADIFGDGHKVYWQINGTTHRAVRMNKDGSYQQWSWTGFAKNGDDWRLADLFGDGRQVFWTRNGSTHYVNRLNQDGTIESFTYAGHGLGSDGWDMGDLYGDGRQVYWTQNGTTHHTTSFSRGDFDNLKTVTGSTGLKQASTYASINQPTTPALYTSDRATASAAVFPQKDIQFPMRVVKQVATDTGLGGTSLTTYTYGGLKSDQTTGRGFLGFRWMGSKDLSTNIETMSVFHQTWPYVGMLKSSETRLAGSGNGGLLKRSTVTPGCKIPLTQAACAVFPAVNPPGTLYFPYTSLSVDESWDLNGTAFPVVTTSYQYNLTAGDSQLYGNPTQITATTSLGLIVKTVNTVNEYFPANTTNWVLGRLKKSTVTNTATDSNITTGNPILPLPTINVSRLNGLPMRAPGTTGATWNTTNATSVTYVCTSSGTGYTAPLTTMALSGSTSGPTSTAWIGYPSTCTWTAIGQGGTATYVETLTTVAPTPTISVTRTPLPLKAGQNHSVVWSTTNATSVTQVCTSTGTGYTFNGAQALSGNTVTATSAAWVGYPTHCVWTATGSGGTATAVDDFTTVAIPAPTIAVNRTPLPLVAGQNHTTVWNTSNATSVGVVCTSSGTGYTTNGAQALSGNSTSVASAAWVGYPSHCVWTATGPGGTATAIDDFSTVAPPAPPRIPVYRVRYDLRYFHTTSVAERDWHINNWGAVYEGIPFYVHGSATAIPGLSPVWRYKNTNNSTYFYVINAGENASMVNYPQFSYEGIAWYAQQNNAANGVVPLYRYRWYDTGNQMYFYTTTNGGGGDYNISEGISQYVWTAP